MKKLFLSLSLALACLGAKAQQYGCPVGSLVDYIACVSSNSMMIVSNGVITWVNVQSFVNTSTLSAGLTAVGTAAQNSDTIVSNGVVAAVPSLIGLLGVTNVASSNLSSGLQPSTRTWNVNLPAVGTAGTYTRVMVDAFGRATNGLDMFFTNNTGAISRSMNTVYSNATGRPLWCSYNPMITITFNGLLAGAGQGTARLQVSTTSAFPSPATISSAMNGQQIVSLLTLSGTQPIVSTVAGFVPPNYCWRVASSNDIGSPTFTIIGGQEVAF